MRLALGSKNYSALVLNADYRPLSYFPLSLWPWQAALKAVFLDRVNVLHEYQKVVRSPSTTMRLPSVVALNDYIKPQKGAAFTRFNLFLRDGFRCQYCGSSRELTFDHVVPLSQGGMTSWTNVVAACPECNFRKGSKTLKAAGMKLLSEPREPSNLQLHNMGRKFPPNYLHETWIDFLYWDAELDPDRIRGEHAEAGASS